MTTRQRLRVERWVTYALWAAMLALLAWGALAWQDYLADRAEQAEAQTRHMAHLIEDTRRTQAQMETLLEEFRDVASAQKERSATFREDVDAIMRELGVQVERLSARGGASLDAPVLARLPAEAPPAQPPQVAATEPVPEPAPEIPPAEPSQPRPEPDPPQVRAAAPEPAPDAKPGRALGRDKGPDHPGKGRDRGQREK